MNKEGHKMNKEVKVLDHGHIRLVDHMGDDMSIVRSARVSYDAEARTGEDAGKDEGLINYLMKNKHSTPFEAATVTFQVKAPIFVFRQWHRHRTQSFNEVSARYTELPEEFYVPKPEHINAQAKGNKQCREGEAIQESAAAAALIRKQCEAAFVTYKELQELGVPRELSRSVLPVNTYSKMFCTMNLLNCYKFLQLRVHSHAQYEIRVYAEAMLDMVEELYPMATKAFRKHVLDG